MEFARAAKDNPLLREALTQVVLFKSNTHEPDGEELSDEFGVKGIPHFFVMSPGGAAFGRWRGYGSPEGWLNAFEDALADPTPADAKAARFDSDPSETRAAVLARLLSAQDDSRGAVRYYREAQRLAGAPNGRYSFAVFLEIHSGVDGGEFSIDEVKAAATEAMAAPPVSEDEPAWVGYMMARLADGRKDPSLLQPWLDRALAVAGGLGAEHAKLVTNLRVAEALQVRKDPEAAFALKRDGMPPQWDRDPDQLNALAWWCFEQRVRLEEAEAWARKGVELATDPREKAMILDTAAEICAARDNCTDAVSLIAEAAKLDPDSEHYKKQLARFQDLLAKQNG